MELSATDYRTAAFLVGMGGTTCECEECPSAETCPTAAGTVCDRISEAFRAEAVRLEAQERG